MYILIVQHTSADFTTKERCGVDEPNKTKSRKGFHLFRRQKRSALSSQDSTFSSESNTPRGTNSRHATVESVEMNQDELEKAELVELLMCPSKVLRTNVNALGDASIETSQQSQGDEGTTSEVDGCNSLVPRFTDVSINLVLRPRVYGALKNYFFVLMLLCLIICVCGTACSN